MRLECTHEAIKESFPMRDCCSFKVAVDLSNHILTNSRISLTLSGVTLKVKSWLLNSTPMKVICVLGGQAF